MGTDRRRDLRALGALFGLLVCGGAPASANSEGSRMWMTVGERRFDTEYAAITVALKRIEKRG